MFVVLDIHKDKRQTGFVHSKKLYLVGIAQLLVVLLDGLLFYYSIEHYTPNPHRHPQHAKNAIHL
jgi:hypothetical protein